MHRNRCVGIGFCTRLYFIRIVLHPPLKRSIQDRTRAVLLIPPLKCKYLLENIAHLSVDTSAKVPSPLGTITQLSHLCHPPRDSPPLTLTPSPTPPSVTWFTAPDALRPSPPGREDARDGEGAAGAASVRRDEPLPSAPRGPGHGITPPTPCHLGILLGGRAQLTVDLLARPEIYRQLGLGS